MTHEQWEHLNVVERSQAWRTMSRAEKDLFRVRPKHPQLDGLLGCRIEVTTDEGETYRFYVGQSSGWAPCYIEIKRRNSLGGHSARQHYRNITVIGKL